MPKPVIVLIFAHKSELEWYERIGLRQCVHVLERHPIRLVCPEGLDVAAYKRIAPAIEIDFIPSRWLASLRAYNRLKILPWLYRRYADYEFILSYELDAFVFRDELLDWCAKGWDYIGAPWFEGHGRAMPDARPCGVGNSGFSLRRTQAMLRTSRRWRYQQPLREVVAAWLRGERTLKGVAASLTFRNNFFPLFNNYFYEEDFFWCHLVVKRFPWFRLAPFEEAKRFSFEVNPRRLFRECGNKLPFGCHKWMVYDLQFWKSHIQSYGYEVPIFETNALS